MPVQTGAVFSDPAGGDPTAIVRAVCSLIKQADAGSRIRLAHFAITGDAGMDFVDELIAAHRRDVDVQMVIDGGKRLDDPVMDKLQQELGTDESARSWVHPCSRLSPEGTTAACIGDKGQHNKFFLFSKVGGSSDVVVQSSANVTDLNSTVFWNNAVTFVGNTDLYAGYDSYFDDMANEVETDDYYRVVPTTMPDGEVQAHFFPRAGDDASTDPVVEKLDDVKCGASTTIRIGAAEWDSYRIAIADRLVELAGQGCTIYVVHAEIDDDVRNLLADTPGIELRELRSSPDLPGNIHSKYMTVDESDSDTAASWVLTGSHNYSENALRRNDETLLYTDISKIHEQYEQNFAAMWQAAAPASS